MEANNTPPSGTHLANLGPLPFIPDEQETRVITVRLPKSLHAMLRLVADREHTSLNLLCIAKLIAQIDNCPVVVDGRRDFKLDFAIWRDTKFVVRRCRACKCTEADCSGCIARTGQPCHWVEWDLCSACQPTNQPAPFKGTA